MMSEPRSAEEHPERSAEPDPPVPVYPPLSATPQFQLDCPKRVIRQLVRLEDAYKSGCVGIFSGPWHLREARLLKQLEDAKPELLIAGGPEEANRIFEHVHPLIAPFTVGAPAKTLEQAVKLIALNLDWYIKPARPLFRSNWIWQALVAVLLLWGSISLIAVTLGSFSRAFTGPAVVAFLLSWPVWLGCHGDPQRALQISTLLKHLRAVYGLPEGGGEAVESQERDPPDERRIQQSNND